MKYKKMQKGEYVFEYQDIGDNLYLILDGSVEVQIPDKKRLGEYELTKLELCVKNEKLKSIC